MKTETQKLIEERKQLLKKLKKKLGIWYKDFNKHRVENPVNKPEFSVEEQFYIIKGQIIFAEKLIKTRIKDIEQDKVLPDFVKSHLKIKLKELEKECQK